MLGIIDSIKDDFANAVKRRCKEEGCVLRLDRLKNYVALKGESVRLQFMEKICDYIVFKANGQITVGVVELRGKNPSVSEVIKKLENGKVAALDILEKYNSNFANSKFCFLILAKGWDPSQLKKIEKERIDVKGKKHRIVRERCGVSFYDVIRN